jgi:Arc/MetJ-type ribon-helix-helix transcriptional regulator
VAPADRRVLTRDTMARKGAMEKVTFTVPTEQVQELRRLVREGTCGSQNEVLRAGLSGELKRIRNEQLALQMAEAMKDPRFVQEMEEIMRDFEDADAESARMIPE